MTTVTPPPLSPDTDQLVQPVIVTLVEMTAGSQVKVQHYPWGVSVDVRPDDYSAWTPASFVDGMAVEVKSC